MSAYLTLLSTFSIPIAIFFIRNGVSWYRSIRSTQQREGSGVRPLNRRTTYALNLLFVTAMVALFGSHSRFLPPNIYAETNARYQTKPELIFSRVAAQRALTSTDQALRSILGSETGRQLYFVYGPYILTQCTFCDYEEQSTYLLYGLPTILRTHLLHITVLGIVTSRVFGSSETARWRAVAVIAGAALAIGEIWMTYNYELSQNSRATRPGEIDFFFWRITVWRSVAMATVDALLGLVIWLSATERLFVDAPSVLDKLNQICRTMEQSQICQSATGDIRNAVLRDDTLRESIGCHWVREEEIFEQREVETGVNSALSRLDAQSLKEVATRRADQIMRNLQVQSSASLKAA